MAKSGSPAAASLDGRETRTLAFLVQSISARENNNSAHTKAVDGQGLAALAESARSATAPMHTLRDPASELWSLKMQGAHSQCLALGAEGFPGALRLSPGASSF